VSKNNHLIFSINTSGHRLQPERHIKYLLFYFWRKSVNPIQSSQQIARNRNPLNTYIYIEGRKNKISFKNGINQEIL
jgi:hypothetical protein